MQVIVEISECGLCKGVLVYWEGRYQHLTDTCPDYWGNKLPEGN